ncbi:hypothetical protein D9M72_583070 [compost metagenome]
MSGSQTGPNLNESFSETLEVHVHEDSSQRVVMMMGQRLKIVAAGTNSTHPTFKAVGQDRSTEDVWDMASKSTGDGWVLDAAIRINRRTGTISATSQSQFANGLWGATSATGNCVAQSAARKF